MLPPLFNISAILDACRANELILTANERLCRHALNAWGQLQLKEGRKSWASPRIYSIDAWLNTLWEESESNHGENGYLIASSHQERVLWEEIIKDHDCLQPTLLAKQCQSAYRTLEQWQLPLDALNQPNAFKVFSENSEEPPLQHELLKRWCFSFVTMLQDHGLITREGAYSTLLKAFQDGRLTHEAAIHCVGFDTLSPLYTALLHEATDVVNSVTLASYQQPLLTRHQFSSLDDEINAAAQWAKTQLETSPNARIAIISPQLSQLRDVIETALIETFEPHYWYEKNRYSLPFNISAGTPLSNTPFVSGTLALFDLAKRQWPLDTICQLIFSPLWGEWTHEFSQRHQLATRLRKLGKPTIQLSDLHYWSTQLFEEATDNLSKHLLKFQQTLPKKSQRPSSWSLSFMTLLEALNWPGERTLDTLEHQQAQAFYQLLETFGELDSTLGEISFSKACHQLALIAQEAPFQVQVADSPIQVLGILESAGLQFTHCWVLGLDENQWPPQAKPHPLLPLTLQKQHNMPRATREREWSLASALLSQLQQSAHSVVLSSVDLHQDTQLPVLPSKLIQDVALTPFSHQVNDFERYQQHLFDQREFTWVDCEYGPPLQSYDGEPVKLKGGASVLKSQSLSPFNAFAKFRLGASNPIAPSSGFSAIEKGNILHFAMAGIWRQLKDQKTLINTSEDDLEALVTQLVKESINNIRRIKPDHLGETLCRIELERQSQLIMNWMEFEKHRPPFQVVSIEEKMAFTWQGTAMELRIDRIDQLEDGQYLIIDYKTGDASPSLWAHDRPADPQLPLYLLALQEKTSGITFAQINVKGCTFKGVHNGNYTIKGLAAIGDNRSKLPLSWEAATHEWREKINLLLSEYLKGYAALPDQKNPTYSEDLLPLNRQFEADILQDLHEIEKI